MGDEQAPKATPRLSKMEVKDVLETQEEIQEVQPNIENSNIVVHVDENEETENVKSVHFEDIRGEDIQTVPSELIQEIVEAVIEGQAASDSVLEEIVEVLSEVAEVEGTTIVEDLIVKVIEEVADPEVSDTIDEIEKAVGDFEEKFDLDDHHEKEGSSIESEAEIVILTTEHDEMDKLNLDVKSESKPAPLDASVSEAVAQENLRVENQEMSRQKQIKMTLQRMNHEGENHFAKSLLSLVKSPRIKNVQTETMVVREKKRATILNSIDVDAVDIIIDERLSKDQPKPKLQSIKVKTSLSTKIEVGESSIHLVSNPWILKAFSSTYGDSKSINAETIKLEKSENGAQHVKFSDESENHFDWVIKSYVQSNQFDKETFITYKLGPILKRFCVANSKTSKRIFSFPFHGAFFADEKFAAFEFSNGFDSVEDVGLESDTLRVLLKTLARFHAINLAFQLKGDKGDVQELQNFLKTKNDAEKLEAPDTIQRRFTNLLTLLQNLGQGGANVSEAIKARFSNTVVNLVSEAQKPTNNFNILCHGKPIPGNFKIKFSNEGSKVDDTRLTNFSEVKFSHPLADVTLLLNFASDLQSEEKNNFLLRFVYYETLISTLKNLGVDNLPDFEVMKKEFSSMEIGITLLSALHLAEAAQKAALKSKQGSNLDDNLLANKAKTLLEKIVQADQKKIFF